MSLKQRIYNIAATLLPNNHVFAEYYKRGGGKKAEWTRQANTLNAKEIKDWRNSVISATDPNNPRRGELMRFYQNLFLDNHLASVIDTRILRVQRSSFKLVDDNGNENEAEKTPGTPLVRRTCKIGFDEPFSRYYLNRNVRC